MSIGVVVIGRNEGKRLEASLSSVLASGNPVIYVDSGSTDGSLEVAERLGINCHSLNSDSPFSAARGRNEGFVRLVEMNPDLEAVLFLDGDCTIDDQVIPAARRALEDDSRLGLVCSPVRELNRDQSIWKRLCDMEWDQPPGVITHCGGIFTVRVQAFREIGGMDAGVQAGEEPEMCLMLFRRGWLLLRLQEGLVLHDVGPLKFRGWWGRSRRAGLAFLLGFLRDGFTRERQNLRETLRPWFWGVALPGITIGLAVTLSPWFLLALATYPIHLTRTAIRDHQRGRAWNDSWLFSVFNLISRWAEVNGQIRLLIQILSGTAPSPHELRETPVFRATTAKSGPLRGDPPKVGVVAIGRNEGERLKACLRSILPAATVLVYVDSGSSDDSIAFAKSCGAIVVTLDMSQPFTAARARNAGFRRLLAHGQQLDYIQFVDGDCSVADGWIDQAARCLVNRPEVAAVCGRRRERFPEASIYNQLADYEWDTDVGPIKWCGGDVLIRLPALVEMGGYDASLIACEEPELCFRLRSAGWIILRIDVDMTLHDANIMHFSQWWRRSTRTGYSYLQASSLHRREPGHFLRKEIRSAVIWGLAFPITLLFSTFEPLVPSILVAGLFLQSLRIFLRRRRRRQEREPVRLSYALFSVLINLPIAVGMLRFLLFRVRGKQSQLIEYK